VSSRGGFGAALAVERRIFLVAQLDVDCRDVSSRCLTFEVPGIGSITGLRLSTQASEIWLGAAPCALAIRSRIEPGLASSPAASGYHGMKPMP
jgi:hypothetical protein